MDQIEDIAILRAQLADAQANTQLWLAVADSNEERVYVRRMQERLGDLERILDRIELRGASGEPNRWDENVKAFLEAFRGAKEVRGCVVGTGLNPLAARLGKQAERSEGTLHELAVSEQGQATYTASANQVQRVPTSKPIEQGKFCNQVINEIKKIKNLSRGSGWNVAEIQQEHPNWAVWKVRELLGQEDKEIFNHPNQWGPTVGYAKAVLSKTNEVSMDTITSWVKAYRKSQKTKLNPL